jgi:hypothetical protein
VQQSRQKCSRLVQAAILIFTTALAGHAQSTNSGDFRGTVTDQSGAVIPGAKVTVTNIETGVAKEYTTNADGLYDTFSILPGQYRIVFSKEGFEKLVRDGITLQVGILTVNAQLTVGTAQTQIEITGQATLLKTESAEQGATLPTEVMTELPNVTRDWSNFTKVLPGAEGTGTAIVANGTMPYYSSFMADGASTTLPHSSNLNDSNFEAVSEVQVQTSTFSAQYGTGAMVFNQISKSGTNQWHGSAYEFLQNNDLNARSFFSPSVPIKKYNNFGGSVGGPIFKNKMFFFFNVDETTNNSLSYGYHTYPTADMLAGNFSNPIFPTIYDPATLSNGVRAPFPGNIIPTNRLDPLALAVQKYFPTPNLPGYSNNLLAGLTSTSPDLKWFGRIDYNMTNNNRVTFSITQQNNPAFTPSVDCPVDCYHGDVDAYNVQLSDVWTITPSVVNEFRFGYVRQGNWFSPETLGEGYPAKLGWDYALANLFPGVTIGGPVGGTSIGTNDVTAIYAENSLDPSDVVTMIKGRHILHFGAEVLTFQDNDTPWGNVNSGNFGFTGVYTASAPYGKGGLGYADFLLGQVNNWNATNSPIIAMREASPQFFAQDDFKVTPHITLNLGLRYQVQGGWYELHNRVGDFDPTIVNPLTNTPGAMWFSPSGRSGIESTVSNIFLPRIGAAWSPKNNWVIRGGFGIYSYGWSEDTYAAAAEGFGANSTGSLSDSVYAEPLFQFSSSNPPLNYVGASTSPGAYNGHSVNFAPYHTPVARNYEWSFSVERQLPSSMVAEIAYTGSHADGLDFPSDVNQVPGNLLGVGTPQNERPYPQFLTISGSYYNAISNYDSLQLSLKKRFTRGLSFEVNYTWSKMLDDQDSSGWGGQAGSQDYQSSYNLLANYGLSNFDRPQMFKGDFVYQLPVGKGRQYLNRGGALDALVGGWQASSIFTFESGSPYTLTMGGQDLDGALSGNWYPNLVGSPGLANPTLAEWFNPAAFAQPAAFTFGTAGRNILFGPAFDDVDFSMAKSFLIPKFERAKVQLRFDATNIINHPCFSNPNGSIGTPAVATITGTSVGGRVLQVGARFSF